MAMLRFSTLVGLGLVLLLAGCEKDDPTSPNIPLILEIEHYADDEPLALDSMKYLNTAGNQLSVTRLTYFLSGWELMDNAGEVIAWDDIDLVDAEHS